MSGAQTGVDRAALDVALALGLGCGGWVPRGRRSEDGRVPARYPVKETDSDDYAVRTRLNVRDSDGTLIVTRGAPTGGTALTIHFARELGRPWLVVDLDRDADPEPARDWLRANRVGVLNVAGPRESTIPGITSDATDFLTTLLAEA